MKQMTSVTIDSEILQKARIMKINISGALNNMLRNMTATTEGEIDLVEIEKEIEEIDKKMIKLSLAKSELFAKKTAFEEKKKNQDQAELNDLLKEADMWKRSGVLERV